MLAKTHDMFKDSWRTAVTSQAYCLDFQEGLNFQLKVKSAWSSITLYKKKGFDTIYF